MNSVRLLLWCYEPAIRMRGVNTVSKVMDVRSTNWPRTRENLAWLVNIIRGVCDCEVSAVISGVA